MTFTHVMEINGKMYFKENIFISRRKHLIKHDYIKLFKLLFLYVSKEKTCYLRRIVVYLDRYTVS